MKCCLVVAGMLLSGAVCGADLAEGPRTSVETFFRDRLDTSLPALADIPRLMQSNDLAGAEHVFAAFVRASLRPRVVNAAWYKRYSDKTLKALKRDVDETMAYRLTSCRTPHQFPVGHIDWELNPTFNKYCEWTWQLSRHPFWTRLAEYYTVTRDENVAAVWVAQLDSWLNQAICPKSASPYATSCWRTIEAGIRMSGWSHQIHAFANSPAVTDHFLTRYFISIWEHGWRLRNNSTCGNWLLMELHGLLRIAKLYPFLRDAPEWKSYAVKLLQEEFARQVYPDGFQYELSTGYHGVVVDNYLDIFSLYDYANEPRPEFIRVGLEKMFETYIRLARPDGLTPDLNDGAFANVAKVLSPAKNLYPQRADFLWAVTKGAQGSAPEFLSCVFPYSGAVVFRSSWSPDAVWGYMDASPFGRAHQHEDKLNFLMNAYGKTMLTEGGNYMYDTSDCRKYVLSTRAHNTIRIDGLEQNIRKNYKWHDADILRKADVSFQTTPGRDVASSAYRAGYGAELLNVEHLRKVIFVKDQPGLSPFFVIVDRLFDPKCARHTYEQAWHLETCELSLCQSHGEKGPGFCGDFGNGIGLYAASSDAAASIRNMQGQYKPYYQGWRPIWKGGPHEHRPIPTPVVCGCFQGSHRVVTVLYPYRDGHSAIRGVKASPSPDKTDLTLELSDGTTRTLKE